MRPWLGLMLFVGGLFVWSCGTSVDQGVAGRTERTYEVRGLVRGVIFDGKAIKVTHEEIPGFMKAMTMDLEVEDPSETAGFSGGEKVVFILVVKDDGMVIRNVRVLPPSTKLALPDAGEGSHSH